MQNNRNDHTDNEKYQSIRNMRWSFILLALIFVLFCAGYSWLTWHNVKRSHENDLLSVAELSGNSLDAYFKQYEYSLKSMANELMERGDNIDLRKSRALLKRFLEIHPDILISNINRVDGQILVSTEIEEGKPLPSQGAAPSYQLGIDELQKGGNFNIGRPTYGPLAKGWVIQLRYAMRNKRGGLQYVLVAVLPLSRQQSFWHDQHLPKGTALGLLRDDAYLLSRYPDSDKLGLEELYSKPRTGILVEHLQRNGYPVRGNVNGYSSVAQQELMFGYRRMKHFPVTLFVTMPISNVYANWWQQVQFVYLLLFLLILGGYGVYRRTRKNQLELELEREQHEEKLFESEQRFRRVASEAPFPMMIHAENGEVLEINKAWSEATGYTHADIPDIASWLKHAYEENPQPTMEFHKVRELVERMYGIGHRVDQGERAIRCKDGSVRTWHFSAAPVGRLPDGRRYVVSMAQDVTEGKVAQEKIEFLAYHDALTNLPNRLLAKDHLQQAILDAERERSKVALLFVDLDKFKTINDSLGHLVGDELLKGVSARLRECLRDSDTLSRQGGDEFLIILKGIRDSESITVVTEKILERLAQPFLIEQHELAISLSIGIAVYPDDGADFETLLKKSDTAMYQAKESGRNTYRFHTEQMNIDAMEHLQLRNGLRHALEQGEFMLHYQPQVSLKTGRVVGAEALLRWNHPQLGMVPPGKFISVAEDSGLILPIGDWVIREACRQAVAWRGAGLPELFVAINLSAVQFKRGDVAQCVIQSLHDSGLPPECLELELTESILIKDTEKVLASVSQLKSLGIKLSIDDFGTGYSSLSYLKQFNVDKLKIDQSFIRDMADDPNDTAIVTAIIQMAKSLNLAIIAEGVEDERQLDLLRKQQCDEIQGYYYAKPMPSDDFVHFVSRFHQK